MTGAELIAGERARQQYQCGWTVDHDRATHGDGQLKREAISILLRHTNRDDLVDEFMEFGIADKAKVCDQEIRALSIAGALIAAEIDRLLRAAGEEQAATEEWPDDVPVDEAGNLSGMG